MQHNNESSNLLEDLLKPLKENQNCQDLYQKQLHEIKAIASHFQIVQNTYAQAFKRIHALQQQLHTVQKDWDKS